MDPTCNEIEGRGKTLVPRLRKFDSKSFGAENKIPFNLLVEHIQTPVVSMEFVRAGYLIPLKPEERI